MNLANRRDPRRKFYKAHANHPCPGPSKELAKAPRCRLPQTPCFPSSRLPLEFIKGERIAFLGNSLAERMNLSANF